MAKRSKKKNRPQETIRPTQPASRTKNFSAVANGKLLALQVAAIVGAVLWIFWPAMHGGWVWDDVFDIPQNPVTRDPGGIWKIWFEPGSQVDYYPIKASIQWMQWQLWQNDTFGYHLTNVLLHILGALLVWRLLGKLGLRFAWLGGLLFAVHPVQVESVAWIAELKNTLSLPPFLLAMIFYIDYDTHGKPRDYLLAIGLFLVAMLCKPTMIMFPFVILLYILWKHGAIRWNDLKTSAPFFAISLALGLVTIFVGSWFEHLHSQPHTEVHVGGFLSRLACAGTSLAFYFYKSLLPFGLLPIYPKWTVDPPSFWQFLPWPILTGMLYWFWMRRESWGCHALLGTGFFMINLAPFIGFIGTNYMDFTWVMNHFLYIPLIGLIGLIVAGLEQAKLFSGTARPVATGIIAVIALLLIWESHSQAELFSSDEALWAYTVQNNPRAWLAHSNLGMDLYNRGLTSESMEQYQAALAIRPDYADAHHNLGIALVQLNRLPEAIDHYQKAIATKPYDAKIHYDLGVALFQSNRLPEAIAEYEQAIKISPDYPEAHNNLGNILAQSGRTTDAIAHYNAALKDHPDYTDARNDLGIALAQAGRLPEAIEQFEQVTRLTPGNAQAYDNLGHALVQAGRIPEAIEQFQQALKINPDDAGARNQLTQLQGTQPAHGSSGP